MTGVTLSEGDAALLPALLTAIPPHIQVLAFGSRVTGRSRPFSDLDLCLKGVPSLNDVQLADLKERFQNSNFSIRVDIVRYDDLPSSFQAEVDQIGVRLTPP